MLLEAASSTAPLVPLSMGWQEEQWHTTLQALVLFIIFGGDVLEHRDAPSALDMCSHAATVVILHGAPYHALPFQYTKAFRVDSFPFQGHHCLHSIISLPSLIFMFHMAEENTKCLL
ncbi:uncharacterized protein LOC119458173 [Dermacentor silvarum]|uniref:uncharacterized protein LOC119458173 n=1 Tax=Dermacentor silvarum TaxID=543639 RepID=UPI002101D3B5|nr:uncharacterized protein LOC119458173 [Dermacentor silvarum]